MITFIKRRISAGVHPILKLINSRDGTWSDMYELGKNRLIKSSYIWLVIVPTLYKLFSKINDGKDELILIIFDNEFKIDIELPFNLSLFYFGALFIAFGNFLYNVYCPRILKENKNYGMFEAKKMSNQTLKDYAKDINSFDLIEDVPSMVKREVTPGGMTISESVNFVYHEKRNLIFNRVYDMANKSRKYSRNAVARYYVIGMLLIGIVLIQNLWYMIKITFGSFFNNLI